jgi:HEAT repeat protein
VAFDTRVGTVEACATCHRIAGTPDQWSRAEHGKAAGNVCLDCHMPLIERPVALGEPPRPVRSHLFPASRSDTQVRRAYAYDASIEGDEVIVRITNKGAGHNFPTATRQRAVESLIVVRDEQGNEVSRSRMVCCYPYASELAPHQLTLPISTQIPSGQTREHRLPLKVASGTVECSLFFKLYRPIEDDHPTLARKLEERRIAFDGVTPSAKPVDEAAEVGFSAPEASLDEALSPAGLVNVARPAPDTGEVRIPEGSGPEDLKQLIALLEFHLPEARARARERLVELGPVAWPALVAALGHWSNETFNQAEEILERIGAPVAPALRETLRSDQLYVRVHAREVLSRIGFPGDRDAYLAELEHGLSLSNPLDRRSSALALGELGDPAAVMVLRTHLDDPDWDVVAAVARSLAALDDREAVPAIERALTRASFVESRRDLAVALGLLGSAAGVPALLEGLDDPDELEREVSFECFFSISGVHLGFEPAAPEGERLEALARLQSWWEEKGGPGILRRPRRIDQRTRQRAWEMVEALGGGSDTVSGDDDGVLLEELIALGEDAMPALIEGLTFPPGFALKHALVCQALGRIGSRDSAPFLAGALRDPVPMVSEWACWALEGTGDPATITQIRRYEYRIPSLCRSAGGSVDRAMQDRLYARAARTRLMLGDESARTSLVDLLLSDDLTARQSAIEALAEKYDDRRGYDPEADLPARREAAQHWRE